MRQASNVGTDPDFADEIDKQGSDEVELTYAGDLMDVAGASSGGGGYGGPTSCPTTTFANSTTRTEAMTDRPQDADHRRDDDAASDADAKDAERRPDKARQDELLDEGIEETFPASDPVAVKHIT